MKSWILAVAMAALAGGAQAEVAETGPQGFRLKTVRRIAAPPAKVYAALGEIGRWWSNSHTYSGKAENMTIALAPGACFCEALPNGGGVQHGRVVAAMPGAMVRLDAALGPLQDEGVSAALTFSLKAAGEGTELTATYHVGGARAGLAPMAPIVDGVLTEQVNRLKRYAETGAP